MITDLADLVAQLDAPRRARFERLFRVDISEGRCIVPASMRPWVTEHFGSVARVEHQQIVRVTNRITFDGALYNPVRAGRPIVKTGDAGKTWDKKGPPTNPSQARPHSPDIFADPLRTTAADVFGRVRGQHCITTGNIARWEGQHAVVIFDEYDPLIFDREQMRDYFATSLNWAHLAHQHDPLARYLFWGWNGGLKGGASIPHAHAQVGLGRHQHYAQIERLRLAAQSYRAAHNSNYFEDLIAVHQDIGLGFSATGLPAFIYAAAWATKDIWIIGQAFDDALANALCDTLRWLIDTTGMGAFNVGVLMPPLFDPAPSDVNSDEDWRGFPVIARIVDRGAPDMLSSDIGALDVFAHQVIAADPYQVIQSLPKQMLNPF